MEVVVSDDVDIDKISIGCTVDLLDVEFDETLEYKIVGSTEASSLSGYISNESPLGKALIGSKVVTDNHCCSTCRRCSLQDFINQKNREQLNKAYFCKEEIRWQNRRIHRHRRMSPARISMS